MKSAFSDFISGKKGIYGILHIIILIMSLFLVISISVDTFKGIPFYTQSSYMKVQLCICLWFLFDFVLEFFLAKHKGRYLRTHFIFLLVAIPYQNIIAGRIILQMDKTASPYQIVLWDFSECGVHPDMDCRMCLLAVGLSQEEELYRTVALPHVADCKHHDV